MFADLAATVLRAAVVLGVRTPNWNSSWRLRGGCAIVVMWAAGALPLSASAQSFEAMSEVLRDNSDFRLRAQAALAMGRLDDARVVGALTRALRDDSSAVRSAAIAGLRQGGSPRALPALRRLRRDPSPTVREQAARAVAAIRSAVGSEPIEQRPLRSRPAMERTAAGTFPSIAIVPREARHPWSRVRYVVTLGDVEAERVSHTTRENTRRDPRLHEMFRAHLLERLEGLTGVAVFASNEALEEDDLREIERRAIPRFQLNARVRDVGVLRHGEETSVRCAVALMLLDGSSSIRGELRGAATGVGRSLTPRRASQEHGRTVRALTEQALAGAVQSALTRAPRLLAQATAH